MGAPTPQFVLTMAFCARSADREECGIAIAPNSHGAGAECDARGLTACVCPRCQRGILAVRRNGVSGKPFWACSVYGRSVEPCDYTELMNGTAGSTYLPAAGKRTKSSADIAGSGLWVRSRSRSATGAPASKENAWTVGGTVAEWEAGREEGAEGAMPSAPCAKTALLGERYPHQAKVDKRRLVFSPAAQSMPARHKSQEKIRQPKTYTNSKTYTDYSIEGERLRR